MRISQAAIAHVTEREKRKLEQRDRIVIVVDDGIATGSTLKVALSTIKQQNNLNASW